MTDISGNPEMDDVYQNALVQYGHLPNVTAIDIGYKYTNGERSKTLAVRIHLKKKRPKSELSEEDILPETLEGFPVDVIEANYIPHAANASTNRTTRFKPLQPGISVGNIKISAGTLGLILKDNNSKKPAILSNWHVLAGNTGKKGDSIVQPGKFDGGKNPQDKVATLERMILDQDADCAIALLNDTRKYCKVLLIL